MPLNALGWSTGLLESGREDSTTTREDGFAISSSGSAIGATLQSSGWREAFNCELLQDGTLVLTGTGATRVGPSPNSTYSLDTLRLELDANRINFHGQYRDAQGHTGPVVLRSVQGGRALGDADDQFMWPSEHPRCCA